MSEIKLPVRVVYLPPAVTTPVLLDSNDIRVSLQDAADAINATARRCDGCKHWHVIDGGEFAFGRCAHPDCGVFEDAGEQSLRDADDCCRKGWEPR